MPLIFSAPAGSLKKLAMESLTSKINNLIELQLAPYRRIWTGRNWSHLNAFSSLYHIAAQSLRLEASQTGAIYSEYDHRTGHTRHGRGSPEMLRHHTIPERT